MPAHGETCQAGKLKTKEKRKERKYSAEYKGYLFEAANSPLTDSQ